MQPVTTATRGHLQPVNTATTARTTCNPRTLRLIDRFGVKRNPVGLANSDQSHESTPSLDRVHRVYPKTVQQLFFSSYGLFKDLVMRKTILIDKEQSGLYLLSLRTKTKQRRSQANKQHHKHEQVPKYGFITKGLDIALVPSFVYQKVC